MVAPATPPTPHCQDQRAVVVVDGSPIPTTRVEVNMSMDGPADRNSYADVEFPAAWRGEDIIAQIASFQDMATAYSTAKVYLQDASIGQWMLVLDGYVRSVGSAATSGVSRLIIGGWEQFFTGIYFSGSYNDPVVTTVLNDVASAFSEKAPSSLSVVGTGEPVTVATGGEWEDVLNLGMGTFSSTISGGNTGVALGSEILDALGIVDIPEADAPSRAIQLSKVFKKNRHTLKDVMDWLCKQTGARWYIGSGTGGPVLTFDAELRHKHFYDSSLGNSPGVRVITNDAIQEIVPINAVRVNGESAASFGPITIKEIDTGYFPYAEAEYTPLVQRAGGKLRQPVLEEETVTVEATKSAAYRALIEQIQGAVGGDITAWGKPDITPFDHFTGVPVCNEHYLGEAPPIEYEVQTVQHVKESGSEYATRIGVRVWVDPNKITVTGDMAEL